MADVVEQPGGNRDLEVIEEVEFVAVGGRRGDPQFELEAEHRSDTEGLLYVLVEAGEAPPDGALHVHGTVGAVDRLEEERVAGGLAHDLGQIEVVADELDRFVGGEAGQPEHDRGWSPGSCGDEVGDPGVHIGCGVTGGQDEGHGSTGRSALEVRQELQCRVGGPVDVVDDHGDRGGVGTADEPVGHRLEHAVPPRLVVDDGVCPRIGGLEAGRFGNQRGKISGEDHTVLCRTR